MSLMNLSANRGKIEGIRKKGKKRKFKVYFTKINIIYSLW